MRTSQMRRSQMTATKYAWQIDGDADGWDVAKTVYHTVVAHVLYN
jgi:hypothetical protein